MISEVKCNDNAVQELSTRCCARGGARIDRSRCYDPKSMHAFDEMCLMPLTVLLPEDIRTLRIRENASQAVFAHCLNVTTELVSQWEQGEKQSYGTSLKLLTLIEKNSLSALA